MKGGDEILNLDECSIYLSKAIEFMLEVWCVEVRINALRSAVRRGVIPRTICTFSGYNKVRIVDLRKWVIDTGRATVEELTQMEKRPSTEE